MRTAIFGSAGGRGVGAVLVIAILAGLFALATAQGNTGASPQGQETPTPDGAPSPGVIPSPVPIVPTPAPATPGPMPDVTATPIPGTLATDTAGAGVLAALSVLLQEHVYGVIAAAVHEDDETAQAAEDALERNSDDIARLVRSFYGEDSQQEFLDLWDSYVQHLLDYGDATAEEDDSGQEQAMEELEGLASDLESFFTGANPDLQPGTLEVLFAEHGRLMTAAIDSQTADAASETSLSATREVAHQTRMIASVLASGLASQFPEEMQVLDTVYATVASWNRRDVQTFLDLWTDEGLEFEFELSAEVAPQALPQFIGTVPIQVRDFSNIEIDRDQASAEIEFRFGAALERFEQQFIREDGIWRMDISEMLTPEVPESTDVVGVEMDDFSFNYDESATSDGDVAFQAENVGDQPHELALVRLDEDAPSIQELVEMVGPQTEPEGVQFLGAVIAGPGEEQTLTLAHPLTPGRYAMVCFLPNTEDAEGTPHALLGMASEFEVE